MCSNTLICQKSHEIKNEQFLCPCNILLSLTEIQALHFLPRCFQRKYKQFFIENVTTLKLEVHIIQGISENQCLKKQLKKNRGELHLCFASAEILVVLSPLP